MLHSRGHLGQGTIAVPRGDRQRSQQARLDMRTAGRQRVDHEIDPVGDQIRMRRRAALERHFCHGRQFQLLRKQQSGQLLWAAGSGSAVGERLWRFERAVDQVGKALHRRLCAHHHHIGGEMGERDGLKVFDRVIRQIAHQERIDRHVGRGLQQGVPIGGRLGIEIRMDDTMRFTPDTVQIQAGETIRFVVRNEGKVPHELVLGTDRDIREHADAMKKGDNDHHAHAGGASLELAAGQRGELVVHFPHEVTLQMACLVPGHYEAGMRGTAQVVRPNSAPQPSAVHDPRTHKH